MAPEKSRVPENVAEVLEAVYSLEEEGSSSRIEVIRKAATDVTDELLERLREDDLITIDDYQIRLSTAGRNLAEQIIRRHRLAERLLCDVMGSEVEDSEEAACEFEHILAEGITNSICTLLGHPRYCPHKKPIPEGECCRQAREELKPIVLSCDQLGVGESAHIAYFTTGEHARMLKLATLGIRPGCQLKLLQKWPSFVVQCEETEIALEEDVVRNIYVRPGGSGDL
jgi:DtxR family Mn-dependent transcriptional regulator